MGIEHSAEPQRKAQGKGAAVGGGCVRARAGLLGDTSARRERPEERSAPRGSPAWNPAPPVTHCTRNIRFRPLCLSLILSNLLIRVTKDPLGDSSRKG